MKCFTGGERAHVVDKEGSNRSATRGKSGVSIAKSASEPGRAHIVEYRRVAYCRCD